MNMTPCFISEIPGEKTYVSCLGCGARTDLEYAEEFAADLWNERVSYVD